MLLSSYHHLVACLVIQRQRLANNCLEIATNFALHIKLILMEAWPPLALKKLKETKLAMRWPHKYSISLGSPGALIVTPSLLFPLKQQRHQRVQQGHVEPCQSLTFIIIIVIRAIEQAWLHTKYLRACGVVCLYTAMNTQEFVIRMKRSLRELQIF